MSEKNYAFISNDEVVNLVVFDDPSDALLSHFKSEFDLDSIVLATEDSVIGGTYDGTRFWTIQPYPSWVKGDSDWEPPVPMPTDGTLYDWDEPTVSWKERL